MVAASRLLPTDEHAAWISSLIVAVDSPDGAVRPKQLPMLCAAANIIPPHGVLRALPTRSSPTLATCPRIARASIGSSLSLALCTDQAAERATTEPLRHKEVEALICECLLQPSSPLMVLYRTYAGEAPSMSLEQWLRLCEVEQGQGDPSEALLLFNAIVNDQLPCGMHSGSKLDTLSEEMQESGKDAVVVGSAKSACSSSAVGNDVERGDTRQGPGLTPLRFQALLLSSSNRAVQLDRDEALMEGLDEPMQNYFVASSHNSCDCAREPAECNTLAATLAAKHCSLPPHGEALLASSTQWLTCLCYAWLTDLIDKDQLAGRSSADMYGRLLLQGCRSLELDCWDGDDGEPDITHGHTLCTRVKFADCVAQIAKCAFVTTALPVSLSLEMHCSRPQQSRIGELLQELLGDMLLVPAEAAALSAAGLLSPRALSYKVLVKGKVKQEAVSSVPASTLSTSKLSSSRHRGWLRPWSSQASGGLWSSGGLRISLALSSRYSSTAREPSQAAKSEALIKRNQQINEMRAHFEREAEADVETGFLAASGADADVTVPNSATDQSSQDASARAQSRSRFSRVSRVGGRLSSVPRSRASLKERTKKKGTAAALAEVITMPSVPVDTFMEGGAAYGKASRAPQPSGRITFAETHIESGRARDRPLHERPGMVPITSFSEKKISHVLSAKQPVAIATKGAAREVASSHADVPHGYRRFQQLTSRKLARVYPRATRFDSANLDPIPCWRAGAQLVALNLQTVDLATQLHHAMFASAGYVLKPKEMRSVNATAAATAPAATSTPAPTGEALCWPPRRSRVTRVTLRILSLHHLPTRKEGRPRLHAGRRARSHALVPSLSGSFVTPDLGGASSPQVKVELFAIGGTALVSRVLPPPKLGSPPTSLTTPAIVGNGLHAVLNETVHCLASEPAQTFFRVSVLDRKAEVAYETAVLGRLRSGYRCIELRARSTGTKIELCTLFVHIQMGQYELEHEPAFGQPLDKVALENDDVNGLRVPMVLTLLWDELRSRSDDSSGAGGPDDAQKSGETGASAGAGGMSAPGSSDGLQSEGIFRLSAPAEEVQSTKRALDEGGGRMALVSVSVQCLAALIKLYLRELPDDVWKGARAQLETIGETMDKLLDQSTTTSDDRGGASVGGGRGGTVEAAGEGALHAYAQGLIQRLDDPLAAELVVWVCDVMAAVVACEPHNRMGIAAVATVFAPGLVHVPEDATDPTSFMAWSERGLRLTTLLVRAHMHARLCAPPRPRGSVVGVVEIPFGVDGAKPPAPHELPSEQPPPPPLAAPVPQEASGLRAKGPLLGLGVAVSSTSESMVDVEVLTAGEGVAEAALEERMQTQQQAEEARAARLLQAVYRGAHARATLNGTLYQDKELNARKNAAITVQAAARAMYAKRHLRACQAASVRLQAGFRRSRLRRRVAAQPNGSEPAVAPSPNPEVASHTAAVGPSVETAPSVAIAIADSQADGSMVNAVLEPAQDPAQEAEEGFVPRMVSMVSSLFGGRGCNATTQSTATTPIQESQPLPTPPLSAASDDQAAPGPKRKKWSVHVNNVRLTNR